MRDLFFDDLWRQLEPTLTDSVKQTGHRLRTEAPGRVLAGLSPTCAEHHNPPRVIVDKLHHSVIHPARRPLLLMPTWYGAPHFVVKREPGMTPVWHSPIAPQQVGINLARQRLMALTDANRSQLCRLIAREPMTTSGLAARLNMSQPQVSRHLRLLRDLDLVHAERRGRSVYYSLDISAVSGIGKDVVTALMH